MKLAKKELKFIVAGVLKGENHRQVIVDLIDTEFLNFTIEFFKKIALAKIANENIEIDWYKKELLDNKLPADEIIINSGLNKKTIENMKNTTARDVVLNTSYEHYASLNETIEGLIDKENGIDFKLTIKCNSVAVELTINESLIVINTIAVKRAQISGGAWSAQGKGVEGPLMETLCRLYNVPEKHFSKKSKNTDATVHDFEREVDFYLYSKDNQQYKCEVKLMGKGNPEVADGAMVKGNRVFVADKLSEMNKKQLDSLKIKWVQLADEEGYKKFEEILKELSIPHKGFKGNVGKQIDKILNEIL